MKQNPSKNTYYWRAVKRLAERHDVSITKARKMDWKKEANAERKRRSKAHIHPIYRGPKRKVYRTGGGALPRTSRTGSRKPPARIRGKKVPRTGVPPRHVAPKLKFKEYDRIRRPIEEEDFDEEQEFEGDWSQDWEDDYSELNELDDLESFLEDFEYDDDDKYKDPS